MGVCMLLGVYKCVVRSHWGQVKEKTLEHRGIRPAHLSVPVCIKSEEGAVAA